MAFYNDITQSSGASIGTVIAVLKPSGYNSSTDDWQLSTRYPGYLECDGSTKNVYEYPILYQVLASYYGGTATSTTANMSNWQGSTSSTQGTFKLPDYRGSKLVGVGGVDGPGSVALALSTDRFGSSGGTSDEVGAKGGYWIANESRQGAEYVVGSVSTSGYGLVTGDIACSLSGSTSYRIGPLDEAVLGAAPEHNHILLTSEPDGTATKGDKGQANDPASSGGVSCAEHNSNDNGYIYPFEPSASATHSHKISETNFNSLRPKSATYDSTTLGASGTGNSYYQDSTGTSGSAQPSSSNCFDQIDINVSATQSGMYISDGVFTFTAATPFQVTASITPQGDIPLLMKYFRVKYLIKAY